MKKFLVFCLSCCLLFYITACKQSNNLDNKEEDENSLTVTTCSYEIVSAPTENGLVVMDSVTDGEFNWYYIDLGIAYNVPIWSSTSINYNKNQMSAPELKFIKGKQTETSIEQSVSKTISKTVSMSENEETTITAGYEVGPDWLKAKLEISTSRSWGSTEENENSTTDAYSAAQAVAETYQNEVSFSTGGSGYGWYRLSMLSTCDIYAMMKTDLELTKVEEIFYTVCPRNDAHLTIEYSANNDWIDPSAKKIDDPVTQLSKLTVPSKILVDGELLTDTWKSSTTTEVLTDTIVSVTDEEQNEVYGGMTYFTVNVPDKYKYIQSLGKLYVRVTATCNVNLQYRSDLKYAKATINASFGMDEKQSVVYLQAQGGGWPGTWVNPAYGEIVSNTATLTKTFLVDEVEMGVAFNYLYNIEFEEFTHPTGWFGQHGTHAVNFSCDFSNVTYEFYTI